LPPPPRQTGSADLALGEAIEMLRDAGHADNAEQLVTERRVAM
jgi:hypothetical protein